MQESSSYEASEGGALERLSQAEAGAVERLSQACGSLEALKEVLRDAHDRYGRLTPRQAAKEVRVFGTELLFTFMLVQDIPVLPEAVLRVLVEGVLRTLETAHGSSGEELGKARRALGEGSIEDAVRGLVMSAWTNRAAGVLVQLLAMYISPRYVVRERCGVQRVATLVSRRDSPWFGEYGWMANLSTLAFVGCGEALPTWMCVATCRVVFYVANQEWHGCASTCKRRTLAGNPAHVATRALDCCGRFVVVPLPRCWQR